MFLAVSITTCLLVWGIKTLQGERTVSFIWSLGIGAMRGASLVTGGSLEFSRKRLIRAVILANLPQAVLSFLYLFFNNFFTSIFLATEWNNYCRHRKGLRVSRPRAQQRSTHFLSLPFRFAIPLTIISGVFHWLVSQSLFLANVTVMDFDGDEDYGSSINTMGYSPVAIIFSMITATVLTAFALVLGLIRLSPGIPIAGSCSAAISAACHMPGSSENEASLMPLKWGALSEENSSLASRRAGVSHCCFSSGEVEMPEEGKAYA